MQRGLAPFCILSYRIYEDMHVHQTLNEAFKEVALAVDGRAIHI